MKTEFGIESVDGVALTEYPIDLAEAFPLVLRPAEVRGPDELHPVLREARVAVIRTPAAPCEGATLGPAVRVREGLWARSWSVAFEVRAKALQDAVQQHMDEAAQARRYDDIKTAITYADEPAVPRFQAEGRAFRVWRSQVWAFCYWMLDEVAAGRALEPTAAALIAVLPTLELPE